METDSQPLNFETFVPTHDPSLPVLPNRPSAPESDSGARTLAQPFGPMVSQDDAFDRALSAMYWGGYWTAVYHVCFSLSTTSYTDFSSLVSEEQCGLDPHSGRS
jgi:hypothetical protein